MKMKRDGPKREARPERGSGQIEGVFHQEATLGEKDDEFGQEKEEEQKLNYGGGGASQKKEKYLTKGATRSPSYKGIVILVSNR